MSYILLVDDEAEILQILEMTVQMSTSLPVKTALSGNSAWKLIKESGTPSLIISDYRMPDGDGLSLYLKCQEEISEVPYIVCSGNFLDDLKIIFPKATEILTKPECFSTLDTYLNKYLFPKRPLPEYVNVPLDLLLRLGVVEVDLFIRLSEDKLIKVLTKGDMFDNSDSERYRKKSVSHLVVSRADAMYLVETFENFLRQKMSLVDSDKTYLASGKEALDLTVAFSKALGWNEETVRVAKATVDLTIKMISKNPSWKDILSKASGETRYSRHIALISLLSCSIAHQIGWYSDATKQKLVMAALLHDYPVEDERYDDLAGAENDSNYREHPVKVAELARQLKGIPSDVDQILLQHHERPQGTGFPRGLTYSHISPLSAVFIICEELILFCEDKGVTPEIIQNFWVAHPEFTAREPFKKISLAIISGDESRNL